MIKRILLGFLLGVSMSAMADGVKSSSFAVFEGCLQLSQHRFNNEVADTREKMAVGLMYRPSMGINDSMLFVFPVPQKAQFWMKDTYFPVDMLFFDENRVLQEIKPNRPPCKTKQCPIYSSVTDNVKFVLEVSAGTAKRLNIAVGDQFSACQ